MQVARGILFKLSLDTSDTAPLYRAGLAG